MKPIDTAIMDPDEVLDALEANLNDLDYRLRWVLDTFGLYDADGAFAFPDGDIYHKEDWPDK